MSELFGAPQGIIASNELSNQNALTGLKAQEMMGAIAQQPADLAYKQAQARLMGAQASQAELSTQSAQMMLGMDQKFNAEYDARQKLSQIAAASGSTATVADLTNGSAQQTLAPSSLYQRSIARIKWMEDNGVPEALIAPERDKVATGLEHEAIAGYRAQQGSEIQFKQQRERLTQIGGIAKAASASPEQFAQAMMNPDTAKLLPKGMGMLSYEQALPHLTQIYTSAQTTQQQLEVERQQKLDAAKAALDASTTAKNSATAGAAKARASLTQTYEDAIKKNGGERSADAAAAKESSAAARDNADAAKFRAAYPPAPLDSKQWKVGRAYSNADGSKVATYAGNGQWTPLNVPTPRALRSQSALKQAAPLVHGSGVGPDETDSDTGD